MTFGLTKRISVTNKPGGAGAVVGLAEDGDGRHGGGDGLLEEGAPLEQQVRVAPVHLGPAGPLQGHVVHQLRVVDGTLQLASKHDLKIVECLHIYLLLCSVCKGLTIWFHRSLVDIN